MRTTRRPSALRPAASLRSVRPTRPAELTRGDSRAGQAIACFERALGGRQALTDALLVADGADDIEQIVSLLSDPAYDAYALPALCAKAGTTVGTLFRAYDAAVLIRVHLEAKARIISQKLLPVVEDVMTRAAPHSVVCETCAGVGTCTDASKPDAVPSGCRSCHGTGTRLVYPDLDRQKLALELGALLKKSGVSISTNLAVQVPSPTAPHSLEQMQQAMAELLFPAHPVLDLPPESSE